MFVKYGTSGYSNNQFTKLTFHRDMFKNEHRQTIGSCRFNEEQHILVYMVDISIYPEMKSFNDLKLLCNLTQKMLDSRL